MAEQEIVKQNFSACELSENMYGRWDLPAFNNGCRRMKNFIGRTTGDAQYRNGFPHIHHSRLNQLFNLITFEFNDEQAYAIEVTDQMFRFHLPDLGLVLEADVVITGISEADPGVVTTSAPHGYGNGDEVFLGSIVGMTELNGTSAIAANVGASTFELTDVDGNNIDTTGFTTYISGGVVNKIFEIETPYRESDDLFKLEVDQDANTMYITHPEYLPRELTRTSDTAWTLTLQTRTNDPFLSNSGTGFIINAITQANPGVITTSTNHGFAVGDKVVVEEVAGMVEINSRPYIVGTVPLTTTLTLTDLDGNAIDTTAFTAYISGGFVSDADLIPDSIGKSPRAARAGSSTVRRATPDRAEARTSTRAPEPTRFRSARTVEWVSPPTS